MSWTQQWAYSAISATDSALRPLACDLQVLEHGEMKGMACRLHAAHRGAVNSAISQDCSLRNDQDCQNWEVFEINGRILVFSRSKQVRPTKNSASYKCYRSVHAKKFERASVLLCDPMHRSIILLTTTVFCCVCSAPPRWVNGRHHYRLDQSMLPPAAIVRHCPTQCGRPRTPPR